MQPRTRIGIYGGTFNPIHLGHLIAAQTALEAHELNKVLFVPCSTPPHKRPRTLAPSHHRLAMVEAAIEGDLRFECSDIETRREGVSFSVETVREIGRQYPAGELFFIIGGDSLFELHLWKDIYTLLSLCAFITVTRPGFELVHVDPDQLRLQPPWPERLLRGVTRSRLIDISSSDIRHRIAEGLSIRYLVPPAVEMYIAEHHLYQP